MKEPLTEDEGAGVDGPEHCHLKEHLLEYKDELLTLKQTSTKNLYSGTDRKNLWFRRQTGDYNSASLLNDDKLLAYNRKIEEKEVVAVIDVEKALTVGELQPELVLETNMEALKILYYEEMNALVVVKSGEVVQRWEMDWSGKPVLRKQSNEKFNIKGACIVDEHNLLLAVSH